MVVPPVWEDLVGADRDTFTVLLGRLDHEPIWSPDPLFRAYHRALRAGTLAGGRITAQFT